MCGHDLGGPLIRFALSFFPVIPDRFHRALNYRLTALSFLFRRARLFKNIAKALVTVTEVVRRCDLTILTGKAILSNIKLAHRALRMFLSVITHAANNSLKLQT